MALEPSLQENNSHRWLDARDAAAVHRRLAQLGWLHPGERLQQIAPAGEGNMNLTCRVQTDQRSFILKQSRPWVEKYPQIPAPADRALRERDFYQFTRSIQPVADVMPQLLGWDEQARLLMFEDLGPAADCTFVYDGEPFREDHLTQLACFLAALHDHTAGADDRSLTNRPMRELNHEHIFRIPWQPCAVADMRIDLDAFEPGLSAAAADLQRRNELQDRAAALGRRYLADGPHLVHGDFFPGSFLDTGDHLAMIDTEFAYFGDAEFDLGVLIAHLALSRQPGADAARLLDSYQSQVQHTQPDHDRLSRYAACEVIRRLIGVAQLPIAPSTDWRTALLYRSGDTLQTSCWETLFT